MEPTAEPRSPVARRWALANGLAFALCLWFDSAHKSWILSGGRHWNTRFDGTPPPPDLDWLSLFTAGFLLAQFVTIVPAVALAGRKWWLNAVVLGCLLVISTLGAITAY